MNVLLVDDDYFVIAALEKKIDWRELGVDRVYTAFNIAQAREILLAYPIEVLVCDIEMPQGSGLELLAWIREEQLDVQAIFLTNYADFNYAQKAIGLQSFDYFLKPIEFDKLTLILRKAIAKAGANRAATQNARDRGNPELRRGERRRDHWHRLAASAAARMPESSSADETEELFDRREAFVPLLLELFPREGSLAREEAAREDRALFHYALCNILDELFAGTAFEAEAAGELRERQWFAVLRLRIGEESTQRADKQPNPAQRSRFGETDALEDRRAVSTEEAAKTCAEFAREADRLLKCGICVNLANAASARDLPTALRELLTMNERLIQQPGRIFRLEEERARPEASYAPPDLEALDRLLHEKRFDSFLEAIHDYLLALKQHGLRDRSALHLLRLDLMQLIYAHLKSKEIQAHQLYAGRAVDRLFDNSARSLDDMQAYIEYLVQTAADYLRFADRPESVARELQRYIRAHCGNDLTRNSLAEVFFLNPDYLARLFKRETGVSLGAYITEARIAEAKRLLDTTRYPVAAVAGKVGYANDSHFAKLFKQETGCTPNEYRRLREEHAGERTARGLTEEPDGMTIRSQNRLR